MKGYGHLDKTLYKLIGPMNQKDGVVVSYNLIFPALQEWPYHAISQHVSDWAFHADLCRDM